MAHNQIKCQRVQFISWIWVLEYETLLPSWTIIRSILGVNSCDCCTSINGNSMSGEIHQIFSFIMITIIDILFTHILLISSHTCPVMMRKFNNNCSDNGSNNINTYSNTRTLSCFYINGNNINTGSKFTGSLPSRLLCVGRMIIICEVILILNLVLPEYNKLKPLLLPHEQLLPDAVALECNKLTEIDVAFEFGVAVLLLVVHVYQTV